VIEAEDVRKASEVNLVEVECVASTVDIRLALIKKYYK